MAATVEICESNGAGETVTHNITNLNFGSTDSANLDVATYPITVGTHSYEKYIRIHVTAWGGSNKIDNIQIWKSGGAYLTGEGIKTNLTTSGYTSLSYATPSQASYSGNVMPTASPGTANLGCQGSLSGYLSGSATYSDYCKMQLQTTAATPPGNANTKTFSFQYDEQ